MPVYMQAVVEFVRGVPWKPPNFGTLKRAVDMLSEADWQITPEIKDWMRSKNEGNEEVTHFGIEDWDVSAVTSIIGLFYCKSLFNQDISSWNVSAVTDMRGMFQGAWAFNQDIGRWNVSSVTDVYRMFTNATSFNQGIGRWNVSSVTNMRDMFWSTPFNQDISDWNVSSVTDTIVCS